MIEAGPHEEHAAGRPCAEQRLLHEIDVEPVRDLVVVGAGAKAAAIAARVHAVNSSGIASIGLTIVERTTPGASWLGHNGRTSGDEPLAVTPVKDVGFPYQSPGAHGRRIDDVLLSFSWQRFLVSRRRFARWVDAGSPPVRHRDYGEYLVWVMSQATNGVEILRAHVSDVELTEGSEDWSMVVTDGSAEARLHARALVMTGPGKPRPMTCDRGVSSRLLESTGSRACFTSIPRGGCDIAIVGAGDSAVSCIVFLRALRPQARLTVYTPGLPMGRGETFLENRVFSNPESVGWNLLALDVRREFIGRCDRGVFDPLALGSIAYDDQCAFSLGRVRDLVDSADGSQIGVVHRCSAGTRIAWHDYVVNCTGSDVRMQLADMFSAATRREIERRAGATWDVLVGADSEFGYALEVSDLRPSLHVPALAALSQGPGFANLGCLGRLAGRVIEPLLAGVSPRP
jgi:mycobactin lysine-N-oxygenase